MTSSFARTIAGPGDDAPFVLLINEAFKNYLVGLPSPQRGRLLQKLEFLENGLWDTGLRVKKLTGIHRQVVFEARLNRGDRMLFTLGREDGRSLVYVWGAYHHDDVNNEASRLGLPDNASFLFLEPESEEELPELIVDDLPPAYLTQEAVHEKARGDYGPQKWLLADDAELARLLRSSTEDGIELFLHITHEQRAVLGHAPPLLISGTAGSGKSTISVYYLLTTPTGATPTGTGPAGVGAVGPQPGMRRLFLTESNHLKRFAERIYTGLLRNRDVATVGVTGGDAEPLAEAAGAAVEGAGGRPEGSGDTAGPDFLTFRDLLEAICTRASVMPPHDREVHLSDFAEIFANHPLSKRYDAELVWEEIRAIIKGATPSLSVRRLHDLITRYVARSVRPREVSELADYLVAVQGLSFSQAVVRVIDRKTHFGGFDAFVYAVIERDVRTIDSVQLVLEQVLHQMEKHASAIERPMLSFQDYECLGKKRAPTFAHNRREIFTVAEYYQEKLTQSHRWDEIDLTRIAMGAIGGNADAPLYDLVVCDEVQDLADVQISLLFRIVADPRRLVLTGDPKQIINPSGFRWEEVRNRFFERGVPVPDVFHLNLNFRCVGSIVRLANALLDVKQRTVGLVSAESKEDWKFNGRPPYLLSKIPERSIAHAVRRSGAGRIVLTRSKEERESLKRKLATEMVFTIHEAKGLEFDTVLLWRFTEGGRIDDIWRRVAKGDEVDPDHHAHIRHEINLLYVAVTRARNTLIIYDGPRESPVWAVEEMASLVFRSQEVDALVDAWKAISTPQEWEHQGDYFLEREYYRHAVECFRNAGCVEKEHLASAYEHYSDRRYEDAAPMFEAAGELARAADCYQRCEAWEKAARLWGAVGESEKRLTCSAHLLEQRGDYRDAAEAWNRLGNEPRELAAWEAAGAHGRAAALRMKRGDFAEAAAHYEQVGEFKKAAGASKKAKEIEKAARLFFRAKEYETAAKLFRRVRHTDEEIECYRRLDQPYELAKLLEKRKDVRGVLEHLTRFAEQADEHRHKLVAEANRKGMTKWKAAVRFQAVGMFHEAGDAFRSSGLWLESAEAYLTAGEYESAAESYGACDRPREAAAALERMASPNWSAVERYLTHYIDRERISGRGSRARRTELEREMKSLIEDGAYEAAAVRAQAISDHEAVRDLHLRLGWTDEVIADLTTFGTIDTLISFIRSHQEVEVTLEGLTSVVVFLARRRTWMDQLPRDSVRSAIIAYASRAAATNDLHDVRRIAGGLIEYVSDLYPRIGDGNRAEIDDLLLQLRVYNALAQDLARCSRLDRPDVLDEARVLAARVRGLGIDDDDPLLRACAAIALDPDHVADELAGVSCSLDNVWVFGFSSLYEEALSVLAREECFDDVARVCRYHKAERRVGEVYEESGMPEKASRAYLKRGYPEDALRCALAARDDVAAARAYDRLGRYQDALDIHVKRGNRRDSERMRKKIAATQSENQGPMLPFE